MTSAAKPHNEGDPFASLRAPKQEISEEAKEARRRPGLAESIAGYAEAREQDARSAAKPRCEYCGPLAWTIEQLGRVTHKCGCPFRIHSYCQAHPVVCDEWTDIRNEAWRVA